MTQSFPLLPLPPCLSSLGLSLVHRPDLKFSAELSRYHLSLPSRSCIFRSTVLIAPL
ncbi:hypothetical protein KC19_2G105400 [Ceratodon purpureus]|uniref:Uncharacterized protein n=1 Tax=Ceratodon purpureus TaxID=3225 RepID=A0A8T0IU62_CERPU|nr:hypothetical protein KC19_2G105400 [Ceratodon purpureus]